jgi:hypothetical protein
LWLEARQDWLPHATWGAEAEYTLEAEKTLAKPAKY